MQEQKKFRYIFNGKEVDKKEFKKLSEDSVKWFEGNSINSVPFSSFGGFFNGDFKSQRQINDHLKNVLGEAKTVGNSTRHKYTGEGSFHKESTDPYVHTLIFDKGNVVKSEFNKEPDFKDDVITSSNRGEKETMEYFNEVLDTHPLPFFPKRGKTIKYESKEEDDKVLQTFKENVKRIEQEGVKETEGKLNYELDWEFIQQLAERMSQNKGKYEPYNWAKPMDVEKLKQSLFRHVIEVMKGNYSDDGREFGHWESIALNAMMINYQLKNNR
jgi:hypothetical protein